MSAAGTFPVAASSRARPYGRLWNGSYARKAISSLPTNHSSTASISTDTYQIATMWPCSSCGRFARARRRNPTMKSLRMDSMLPTPCPTGRPQRHARALPKPSTAHRCRIDGEQLMTDLSVTILAETAADALAIERLHERTFGPGRFARTAYRVRESIPHLRDLSFTARIGTLLVGSVQ